MSWVEAAWTVKRIEEDLNLSQSISSYIDHINELNTKIINFENDFPALEEIDSPAELMDQIDEANDDIETIQNNYTSILNYGQAFIDTAIIENNNIQPQNSIHRNVLKNTVWFISED